MEPTVPVHDFLIIPHKFDSTIICLSIYKLSTIDPFSMNSVWKGFYLCCMLMQVYLYCWFGNEMNLKVATAFRFYSIATCIFEYNSTE